jgi:hypothetical protein
MAIWIDNVKAGFKECLWDDIDWIHLANDGGQWRAILKKEMLIQFHEMAEKYWVAERLEAS